MVKKLTRAISVTWFCVSVFLCISSGFSVMKLKNSETQTEYGGMTETIINDIQGYSLTSRRT